MNLINQGLIHGPKIPQYAQNVGRAIQKSKIPQWAQALQNRLFSTNVKQPKWHSAINPTFTTTTAGTAATEGIGAAGKELYDYATLPIEIPKEIKKIYIDETETGQKITESLGNKINSLFDKDIVETKKVKKKKKKKKQRLESKKKQRYMKEKEEPSIPEHDAEGGLVEMKKGGHAKKKKKKYAKKQRKRKHYMASGFVKMKKKKKYIT